MLSPAETGLLERDRSLPGLGLLLDEQALSAWLGAPVRRRYVRYKPGTLCVVGADVGGERAFVVAAAPGAAAKLSKTVTRAPAGALLGSDPQRLALAARPAADRDLPALARLSADRSRTDLLRKLLPGVVASAPVTLSHKPQRRWVGLLTPVTGSPVVLRAHRPADADRTAASARLLAGGEAQTPQVLGHHRASGLVAVGWLPGRPLHELLARGEAVEDDVAAAGAALAALHRRPVAGLPAAPTRRRRSWRRPTGWPCCCPDWRAGARAGRPAGAAASAGRRCGHGGARRLLRRPGRARPGRRRAGRPRRGGCGEPAADLACAVGALHAAAVLGTGPRDVERWTAALHAGYAERAELPPAARLQLHLSAALLRRAVEPFRGCRPEWPARCAELLERAELACPVPALA